MNTIRNFRFHSMLVIISLAFGDLVGFNGAEVMGEQPIILETTEEPLIETDFRDLVLLSRGGNISLENSDKGLKNYSIEFREETGKKDSPIIITDKNVSFLTISSAGNSEKTMGNDVKDSQKNSDIKESEIAKRGWNETRYKIDIDDGDEHRTPDMLTRSRGDCLCGRRQTNRIVGGKETNIIAFPWMVQLIYLATKKQFCGGTIINNRYVLTAAHCVEGESTTTMGVRVGHTSNNQPGRVAQISSIIIHQKYKNIVSYDIALIKLKQTLPFSVKIQPVCISRRRKYNKKRGIVTGWGDTFDGENKEADALKVARVKVLGFMACRAISNYQPSQLNNRILCGLQCGSDACQGDSGGPMLFNDGKRFLQIGIVSWGVGCANFDFPGIYTRVSTYLDWIMRNTKDAVYCKL